MQDVSVLDRKDHLNTLSATSSASRICVVFPVNNYQPGTRRWETLNPGVLKSLKSSPFYRELALCVKKYGKIKKVKDLSFS